jgi:hypothetical protein
VKMPEQQTLRLGDWVEVRSEAEILATLDDHGSFDGLMFMPEMRAHCGERYQVHKRADRMCNPASEKLMQRMQNTVH